MIYKRVWALWNLTQQRDSKNRICLSGSVCSGSDASDVIGLYELQCFMNTESVQLRIQIYSNRKISCHVKVRALPVKQKAFLNASHVSKTCNTEAHHCSVCVCVCVPETTALHTHTHTHTHTLHAVRLQLICEDETLTCLSFSAASEVVLIQNRLIVFQRWTWTL